MLCWIHYVIIAFFWIWIQLLGCLLEFYVELHGEFNSKGCYHTSMLSRCNVSHNVKINQQSMLN